MAGVVIVIIGIRGVKGVQPNPIIQHLIACYSSAVSGLDGVVDIMVETVIVSAVGPSDEHVPVFFLGIWATRNGCQVRPALIHRPRLPVSGVVLIDLLIATSHAQLKTKLVTRAKLFHHKLTYVVVNIAVQICRRAVSFPDRVDVTGWNLY